MKLLITHDGYPHADDILSYAVLSVVFENHALVRTRDKEMIHCEADKIVFDVGMKCDWNKYFDHHQNEKKTRISGIPYSAFGLIWSEFGHEYLKRIGVDQSVLFNVWNYIDDTFVRLIDIGDNGFVCDDSKRTSDSFSFGRLLSEGTDESDTSFRETAVFAEKVLRSLCKKSESFLEDREKAKKGIVSVGGTALILEEPIRSINAASSRDDFKNLLFVIQPRGEVWEIKTIQDEPFKSRRELSRTAAGSEGEDLVKATNIPDLLFCHSAGFIATGKTKESLIELALLSLEN